MSAPVLENLLRYDEALQCPDECLRIRGVGCIGQHFGYYDQAWEKGVLHFARDYYTERHAALRARHSSDARLPELARRIDRLNSNIRYNESHSRPAASAERAAQSAVTGAVPVAGHASE